MLANVALLQWSPTRYESLHTLPVGNCTYSVSYCPSNGALISAASEDSHVRLFDLRTPVSAKYHLVATIPVHAPPQGGLLTADGLPVAPAVRAEVLTHDWNKYNHHVVATGGVDKVIRTFDIRNPMGGALALMAGHEYAVRRLAWSPHSGDVLLSGSYDMTARIWSTNTAPPPPQGGMQMGAERCLMNRHTEFVTGVDWCLFGAGGWVATAGWDSRVLLWDSRAFLRR